MHQTDSHLTWDALTPTWLRSMISCPSPVYFSSIGTPFKKAHDFTIDSARRMNGLCIPPCRQGMAHQYGSWCIPSGFFLWLLHLYRLQTRCHHKRTHQWPECSRQGCRPSLTRRAPCSRGLPQRWPPLDGLLEEIEEFGRKYKLPVIIIIMSL